MRIILSGGGTGGHIYPALAIANEIKKRDPKGAILYIGRIGGLEEELVQEAGFEFRGIHIDGLPRKALNKQTAITLYNLFRGLNECGGIIKVFKPDVVIGTGGYVCAPVVLKAQQKGIKTVIQEQNAYPGKTNRFLAKKADIVAINFKEAEAYLDSDHILYTGNPVRDDFIHLDREVVRKELGLLPTDRFVLSFGGSGGQESTNNAMLELLKTELDFKLMHITGKAHYQEFIKNAADNPMATILDYSNEIPKYMVASDLVISSSSAMTLAEISQVGRASILIPKAYTAGNHQHFNAMSYKDAGAAEVITEDLLNGTTLKAVIEDLLQHDEKRHVMETATHGLGNLDGVKNCVDAIEKLI
ncbi:UDP-N-acetylglucosamine--N-acetylmuramyl-(pentapeptide) pyrophosphoryl-undecaprenol N-acetylglucosamine transferase [Peptoniphilus equinus]|uniref:UDP-N-acetylglucosamine--N-acetylmuramyl-(pentapeptide) pyrophosphoryl-undecaprenol N-acetylglucosamine transferase n=1 Tax=Peptoniphilus equinus TaxID=3016343 RepID=A0ABY7QSY5_9FIRM|nr:UDP-N-acetylglucosamine--N-acetylmuramyl-(pentapeptide) pyrophosphoryl-undecaprenol N-acetylglucosamine transferase [Peptoniphilus equinus]WBW49268.1 UDP-N-acetylglucosamine--N-acetylmuramyl-(pentapeptide) pyrophosphoryl-undecaprenol N-acetylglucosamine transferase [Peptoniphilus equinus]